MCCSVYVDNKSVKNVGKSTYGERVGFSARTDADTGQLYASFVKNGNTVSLLFNQSISVSQDLRDK